jgi:hypothetical protein
MIPFYRGQLMQYLVIILTLDIPGLKVQYTDYPKLQIFSSQHALMTKEEIKVLLARGGPVMKLGVLNDYARQDPVNAY